MKKKYETKTDIGLYELKDGYMGSMRITRRTLDSLKALVSLVEEDLESAEQGSSEGEKTVAGKFFISPLRESSRQKWQNPDTAPHFFFKYLTKEEVESYSAKGSQKTSSDY